MHHSAIRPRAFPLGLLAPRCLCAPLILASAPCSALARASPLFGGRKESSPQLLLILVPSDSVVAQPPSSFSLLRLVASFVSQCLRLGAALTRGPGRPSRKCPRPQIQVMCLPHARADGRAPSRARTNPAISQATQANWRGSLTKTESHRGLYRARSRH